MAPRKTIGAEKAERINVFFPPDILAKLKAEAEQKGLTVSALIRMVMLEYLEQK